MLSSCSSTTMCYLAAASAEKGVQPLGSRVEGWYGWFQHRMEAYDGSFHCARVASDVDVSAGQLPCEQSDVLALLQRAEPRLEALSQLIQHPRRWRDTSKVQECVQQSTRGDYPDSSPFREALYNIVVSNAFSTLWTQCNETYEQPAHRIVKMSPELLLRCTQWSLHHWGNWNTDCDWPRLWSQQIPLNTKQWDSVAPHLALHTTQPCHQWFWFLVTGLSSFDYQALWLKGYHRRDIALQHVHSALGTNTHPLGLCFAKSGRQPPDNSIVGTLV